MSQAAGKVLSLLEHVAASSGPVSAMHVASELGLDKSTCSRLLALLLQHGWLVRDARTRLFAVGPTLVGLSATAAISNQLQAILNPLLAILRDASGETVSFHRRTGDHRVCVAGLESGHPLRRALPLGESSPLHHGPSGKVILAFIDASDVRNLLEESEGVLPGELISYLESLHTKGFVSSDDDPATGVGALSVPVFDRDGVFGSLTVAGPVERWNAGRRIAGVPSLIAAGHSLSNALGARGATYQRWLMAAGIRHELNAPVGVARTASDERLRKDEAADVGS